MNNKNDKAKRPQPLPRGRVTTLWLDNCLSVCAVIPCGRSRGRERHKAKQAAAAIVRFHTMPYHEKVEAIAQQIAASYGGDHFSPVCIRAATGVAALLSRRAKGGAR